ncbi:hypothetical protein [Phaeodactylibacter luteus]|uniref:Uncharacterized protein n=1 Tax=Phaeodactylibacter luteus TaxID=1564516 RepID=A0A5C6RNL1_9BACT|nr:hypothetical protein [Phaeodactylibacter luteus]TXB63564.1 hypothetical protein FRY97_08545 [Phaeodactylibacter luteus]
MKKTHAKPFLMTLVAACSLFAYTYLHVASSSGMPSAAQSYDEASQSAAAQEEVESPTLILPDVQLIKQLFDAGKRLLPAG